MAAALKNIASKESDNKSESNIDIQKMLSAIRHSSNAPSTQSPKQSDFWHTIMSGIHMASTGRTGSSSPGQGNSTPPKSEYRDPRLKKKEIKVKNSRIDEFSAEREAILNNCDELKSYNNDLNFKI